ncbi:hypothetical protein LJC14_07040, partial [Treponema sp. OttesenSCG-928-L16]|nr:hypothetical protein [Treponema sp. OttesenSCG-928-L16]
DDFGEAESALLTEETAIEDAAAEEDSEEESFAQVIPEGFVVEADESQIGPYENIGLDEEEEIEEIGESDEAFDILEEDLGSAEDLSLLSGGEEEDVSGAGISSPESGSGAMASDIPPNLKQELKTVLSYMDQLLESLPEDKIEEFARSEYFDTYKKLFEELGLS